MDNHVRGSVELKNYGKVEIKLKTKMDMKDLTIYQLSKLASLKHSTVKSYYIALLLE